MEEAREIQNECCRIIYEMCSAQGNLYAVLKEIIRINGGPDAGDVRDPLYHLQESDKAIAASCAKKITETIAKYC
jgi:N-acetylneuraminate lyase